MFDSYPVYGPFGYSVANDKTSSIKRMVSGYSLRTNFAQRNSLPKTCYPTSGFTCGQSLSSAYYGPTIDSTYPLGAYLEDYDWSATNADLDAHNGRWCVTPEYPNGTYAYFVATD